MRGSILIEVCVFFFNGILFKFGDPVIAPPIEIGLFWGIKSSCFLIDVSVSAPNQNGNLMRRTYSDATRLRCSNFQFPLSYIPFNRYLVWFAPGFFKNWLILSPRKKGNGFTVWVSRSGENGQALDVPGLTIRYILQRKRGARSARIYLF